MVFAMLSVATTACDFGTIPEGQDPEVVQGVRLELVAKDFGEPTEMMSLPGDNRLFVAVRRGLVFTLLNGQIGLDPFLDIQAEVNSVEAEQGLLGLTFHPDYASNGRFFVSYTDDEGDSRIVEYHADPASDVAEPGSATLVLHVPQPFPDQNGGHIDFGPDGMLYIGLGDGGGVNDPGDNGQNPGTLLGSLLRIDVDGEPPYEVPPDNPFVGTEFRSEVWALGLRNPWRFSWDPPGNVFYVADVGENAMEEVNFVDPNEPGVNFGWSVAEGGICYIESSLCTEETHSPGLIYDHSIGCAVVGGVVYRGSEIPQLTGQYLFGDHCEGWIRIAEVSYPYLAGLGVLDVPPLSSINAIAEDSSKEVYFLTGEGEVYKLVTALVLLSE